MQQSGFSSYKALSQAAGLSENYLRALRQGNIARLRLETLQTLAQTLQIELVDLLGTFSSSIFPPLIPPAFRDAEIRVSTSLSSPASLASSSPSPASSVLQHECDRLQAQLTQQKEQLCQEFQQASLQILESLILQLPTAVYAAQQNPQAPAVKLLPLLHPIEALLREWGISAIAPVGTELAYDPRHHQLMEGVANPGDRVRVRYTGYLQGDRLLYRAKVSVVHRSAAPE
jgi:DNA-binding Xre family transcriptional regulator/molecular chaperone GrpE (heat shock protein)